VDRRRVVVTGLGAVTPIGNTAEELWTSLLHGVSGIGPITRFDTTGYPTRIAGELKGFEPLKYIDKKDDRKLDPFLKYAIACAVMAVEDSGLDVDKVDGTRFGVLVGSGIGGITTLLDTHDVLNAKGPDRVSPFFIPMLIVNMASGLISMRFGAKGPNSSVVTACAKPNTFSFLTPAGTPIVQQIEAIATRLYGASAIDLQMQAVKDLERLEKLGMGTAPVCMAKTHLSLSHDPLLRNRPTEFILPVRGLLPSAGAGFVVVLCGDMQRMPGLGKTPAFQNIDIDANGQTIGLF